MSEFQRLFGESKRRSTTPEYYEWKLFKNPYKQGKIYLERKQGIVVGSATITPKKISLWGKELLAAETGDTFTHPEYRRQGIFSRLLNACFEYGISQGIEVIYGLPNSQSLQGAIKLGYLPCPFIKWKYMTKPPRILLAIIISVVKLMLGRKLDIPMLFLLGILKHKFLSSIFPRSKGTATKKSFDILNIDKFTAEIDGQWGSPRYGFVTIRDKTYLNWRYFENPDRYEFMVAKEGDKYLGYVVTKISKNRKSASICDFITNDDRLDVFNALIQFAEEALKKAGVRSIHVMCVNNSPYYQPLLDHDYYDHGPEEQRPVIVFSGTECGKKLLETETKWHFTLSDSDTV